MATPHISADDGAFAKTILLPGDPLRAKWIAEEFLDDAEQVTAVRNVFGYTGTVSGRPVSVMGTGMGIPSISIYATELIDHYGVENLIRVGSCGALQDHVAVRDLVVGLGACTDSRVNRQRFGGGDYAPIADYGLLRGVVEAAEALDMKVHVGNVFSSDLFYPPVPVDTLIERYRDAVRLGVLAVEMEAAGLYAIAAERGAKALAVCTVSDHLIHEQFLSSDDRERSLSDMIRLVLASTTA